MSWSLRRFSVVVVALAVLLGAVLLEPAFGQKGRPRGPKEAVPDLPPPPKETLNSQDNGALILNRDSSLKGRLEAALQAIASENWKTAYDALQKIVDMDPGRDAFAELPRVTKDGRVSLISVSVQTEADRLLGTLPKEAKDLYKAAYGGRASELLKEAREERSLDKLKEVIRRYRHTDAGTEAVTLWATYMLDRGKYIEAAREFESLLDSEGWDKVAPVTLFKAAYAFRQAANQSSDTRAALLAKEERAWEALRERKVKDIDMGGEARTIDDLQEFVAKLPAEAVQRNQLEHALVGVIPSRNGQAVGGPAYLERRWAQPMSRSKAGPGAAKITQAIRNLESRGQPVLPPFEPVAVVAPVKGEKTPLVIYRSFWGLVAVDMKKGKISWESPSRSSLDAMAGSLDKFKGSANRTRALEHWTNFYLSTVQKPAMLLENSTVGTLTTDGNLVFSVEDFQVPPTPEITFDNPWGQPVPNQFNYDDTLRKALKHNTLQAVSAGSGNLKWELGGPQDKSGLGEAYFLGPPLPYEGKLYTLIERNKKLQLLCLETYKEKKPDEEGKEREYDRVRVVSTQTLGDAKYPMIEDSIRRSQVCHLAIADGILVCPTNSGALLAFNLRTNRLVWAYFYRERGDGPEEWQPGMGRNQPLKPGWIMMPDGTARPMMVNTTQQWKVTPPVLTDGKVVFTAPDGRTLNCLDLKDGSRLWTRYRGEDDLFFGGVYDGKAIVVGKKKVRGINIKTGDTAWTVDAGMPSGMGVASDNVYYLPLKSSVKTREPAIAAIDVRKGVVIGETPARERNGVKDVPGNLVFFDNSVVSQSATEVIAYPQLKARLAVVDEEVANNPDDMKKLYERGTLRLEKGDMLGSVEDLRKVLAKKPGKELEDLAREKLYVTLTEFMLRDFDRAETYLKEYEELCKLGADALPEGAEKERARAEERRRRVKFLCLVARGKEQQGKLLEAFEKYQECGALVDTNELFTVPDEPTVKAAADVLAQGRIAAMVLNATPEARKPLEDRIDQKWEEIKKTNDLGELKKFVAVFGSLFKVGKEARLQLAEKLMEDDRPDAMLEAERHLSLLRGRDEAPELKARAIEAMARLCARKGLMEDAMYFYRILGRDYPKLIIRDGKTGADLLHGKSEEKPFLPYLEEPTRVNRIGKVYWSSNLDRSPNHNGLRGSWPLKHQVYQFELQGEPLPFFKRYTVGLNLSDHHLRMEDRFNPSDDAAPYWDTLLKHTYFGNVAAARADAPRFTYQTVGHLVVLQVGNLVFGLDPVHKRVLDWSFDLQAAPGVTATQLVRDTDGSVQAVYNDGFKQRLGSTGPLDGNAVCLQTREGLVALDPVTGRTLWTRTDVGPGNHLFGDDKTIFMVEMDSGGVAVATRALRAYDGVSVKLPDFSQAYQKRIRVEGRTLLYADVTGPKTSVHLYDMLAGKDIWNHDFGGGVTLLKSEDPDLVGAAESSGTVHVMSLKERKEVFRTTIDASVASATAVRLFRDADFYFLAVQNPYDSEIQGGVQPNLMTNLGLRAVPVNGMVYGFGPDGTRLWQKDVKNEMLVLEKFRELPVLFFTARYNRLLQANLGRGSPTQTVISGTVLDKKNGKLLFVSELKDSNGASLIQSFNDAQNFHTLAIDAANRRIEFTSQYVKLVFPYDLPKEDKKAEEKKPGDKK